MISDFGFIMLVFCAMLFGVFLLCFWVIAMYHYFEQSKYGKLVLAVISLPALSAAMYLVPTLIKEQPVKAEAEHGDGSVQR